MRKFYQFMSELNHLHFLNPGNIFRPEDSPLEMTFLL